MYFLKLNEYVLIKRKEKVMLNILWPTFIIISYIYSIIFGKVEAVNNEIFNSVKDAINLSIDLLRNNVFVVWINENSTRNKINEWVYKNIRSIIKLFIS